MVMAQGASHWDFCSQRNEERQHCDLIQHYSCHYNFTVAYMQLRKAPFTLHVFLQLFKSQRRYSTAGQHFLSASVNHFLILVQDLTFGI